MARPNNDTEVIGVDLAPTNDVTVEENVKAANKPIKKKTATKKTGVVTECVLLRVRSTAAVIDTNIVGEIKLATEVEVDLANSTDDFYKVFVPSVNLEGYCMKKFINIGE